MPTSARPNPKLLDMQAGLESGMGALVGALSGINMISGAGMLDSLLCQSPEKLVIDAEGIAMAKRMLDGMKVHTETLATGFYEGVNFKGGDFLKQRITLQLFQKEQHMPGKVIDRDSMRGWKESGSMDTFARGKDPCAGAPHRVQATRAGSRKSESAPRLRPGSRPQSRAGTIAFSRGYFDGNGIRHVS